MKMSEAFPSTWLKAEHLVNDKGQSIAKRVTIIGIEDTEFKDAETGKTKKQRVAVFGETDKKLGLNFTNFKDLARISGQDPDQDPDDALFVGMKIEVYRTLVSYGPKQVPAVRVRPIGGWPQAEVEEEYEAETTDTEEVPF